MPKRFRILAVEPDPACAESLTRLISDRVNAEVVVASSPDAAVAALASQVPDIILISALLPSAGEEQVMWQLKRLDAAATVPVLTIPPALERDEPLDTVSGRLGSLFKRRQRAAPITPTFDRGVLGDRIVEALNQSRAAKPERQLRLAKGGAETRPMAETSFKSQTSLMVVARRPTLWEASAHWRTGATPLSHS